MTVPSSGFISAVSNIDLILERAGVVRSRRWGAAGLAAAIVAGMLTVGTLGLSEVSFSRGLHLLIDLAALNAYIIATQLLLRNGPAHRE